MIRKKIKRNERLSLFKKFKFTCQICLISFIEPIGYDGTNTVILKNVWLEIDHIIPLSKGGVDDIYNKQILCNKCNCKKSNKI